MSLDASAIPVAANGDVFIAPYSDSLILPSDATSTPDAAFKRVGYIDEEGVSFGISVDTEGIPAWQSLAPVRRVVTGQEIQATFAMLEWNEDNLKLAFGGGEWVDNLDGTFEYTPPRPDERIEFAAIIDAKDGDRDYRIVFPHCVVSDLADISFQKGEASKLEVTLDALSDVSGYAFYLYLDTNA